MRWANKYKKDGEITSYKRTPKAFKGQRSCRIHTTIN